MGTNNPPPAIAKPRSMWQRRDPDGLFNEVELRIIRRRRTVMQVYAGGYAIALFGQCILPWPANLIAMIYMTAAPLFVFLLAVQIHGGVMGTVLTLLSAMTGVGLAMVLLINMQAGDVLHDAQKRAAKAQAAAAALTAPAGESSMP